MHNFMDFLTKNSALCLAMHQNAMNCTVHNLLTNVLICYKL